VCLAVPGQILSVEERDGSRCARVRFGGVVRETLLDLVPEAEVGDYVLVHVGFALRARVRTGLERVCLSGGSFQNLRLFEGLKTALETSGFEVFAHAEVPAGDGGLCLGQAMVAACASS